MFAERAARDMIEEKAQRPKECGTEPGFLREQYRVHLEEYRDMQRCSQEAKKRVYGEKSERNGNMNQVTTRLNADELILMALREDISSEDVTTNAVMHTACAGSADLICKQDGVIAGMWVFQRVFELLDDQVKFETFVEDGDEVKSGQRMAVVRGRH